MDKHEKAYNDKLKKIMDFEDACRAEYAEFAMKKKYSLYEHEQESKEKSIKERKWNGITKGKIDANAMYYNMGLYYENQQQYIEALKYYIEAAMNQHIDAMYKVGVMFNVLNERVEAMQWFKKAADMGNAEAMFEIGYMFDGGGPLEEEIYWYEQSAERGYWEAMVMLYDIYNDYYGDEEKGVEWLKKAAEVGDEGSILTLVSDYYSYLTPKEAVKWSDKAFEIRKRKRAKQP